MKTITFILCFSCFGYAQSKESFIKIWSFSYLSNTENSIKQFEFLTNYNIKDRSMVSEYIYSNKENDKEQSKLIIKYLFQPKRLLDLFEKFGQIDLFILNIKVVEGNYDKFGNEQNVSSKIVKTYKIDRESIYKVNWDYVKNNFFIVDKGSVLSSLIFKSAYEINDLEFTNFEKFIKTLGFIN